MGIFKKNVFDEENIMFIKKLGKILQNNVILIASIIFALIILSICVYLRQNMQTCKYDITQFIIDIDHKFDYQITKEATKEDMIVSGWCMERGKTHYFYNYGWGRGDYAVYNNIHFGFVFENSVYEFATRLMIPENQLYEEDNIDYKYCCFNAYIPKELYELYQLGEKCIIIREPDGKAYLIEVDI